MGIIFSRIHKWTSSGLNASFVKRIKFQWEEQMSSTSTSGSHLSLYLPIFSFFIFFYIYFAGRVKKENLLFRRSTNRKKHLAEHICRDSGVLSCKTAERWEVFKRAVCQLKQLVSVWTHSVQEEHIKQCTDDQRHMTKCQIYLTAEPPLWSGTEYLRRIFLLQCVWQRSLVFSIVKHVPDDHPCVKPDSEQS